jgi:hypothetical protein
MKIEELVEKSKSKKQAKTMSAACKNAKFRKKVDIPKDVACDFHDADDLEVGDEIKVGKFRNSKATVKGFKKDDHNQPVVKTDKGDKKAYSFRVSKLEESYQYAMQGEEFFTHEEYQAGLEELKATGGIGLHPSREAREKYKPFGKLGKLTKPEQVMQHQLAGIPKHDWAFHAQHASGSEMQCRICGRIQKMSAKGRPINR